MKKYETFADAYKRILEKVISGKVVNVENAFGVSVTKEILECSFCLKNPESNLVFVEGRNFSIMHGICESMALFSNSNSVKHVSLFNMGTLKYSDNGETLHGSYGARIATKIKEVIEILKDKEGSRQAVLSIYDSSLDLIETSKDIPCTQGLQFMVRDGKLNMHVRMRSNDIILGLPYDVFVFTNLQMVIANELGIRLGNYYHSSASMHIYKRYNWLADEMVKKEFVPVSYRNNCNYEEFKQLSSLFTKLAESEVYNVEEFKQCETQNTKQYVNAILMELNYREEIVEYKSDIKIESWLIPFTKRWYMNGRPSQA